MYDQEARTNTPIVEEIAGAAVLTGTAGACAPLLLLPPRPLAAAGRTKCARAVLPPDAHVGVRVCVCVWGGGAHAPAAYTVHGV